VSYCAGLAATFAAVAAAMAAAAAQPAYTEGLSREFNATQHSGNTHVCQACKCLLKVCCTCKWCGSIKSMSATSLQLLATCGCCCTSTVCSANAAPLSCESQVFVHHESSDEWPIHANPLHGQNLLQVATAVLPSPPYRWFVREVFPAQG
jgi:hypothetical protein